MFSLYKVDDIWIKAQYEHTGEIGGQYYYYRKPQPPRRFPVFYGVTYAKGEQYESYERGCGEFYSAAHTNCSKKQKVGVFCSHVLRIV